MNHGAGGGAARRRDESVRRAAFVENREIDRRALRVWRSGTRPRIADANVSAAGLRRCRDGVAGRNGKDGCDAPAQKCDSYRAEDLAQYQLGFFSGGYTGFAGTKPFLFGISTFGRDFSSI